MSTPYANTAVATAQIAISAGASAVKVGTGGSGASLANRLLWRGLVIDSAAQVYIGASGVNASTGYPLQAGIPEERAYGPSVDIYAFSATAVTIYIEEASG